MSGTESYNILKDVCVCQTLAVLCCEFDIKCSVCTIHVYVISNTQIFLMSSSWFCLHHVGNLVSDNKGLTQTEGV
jgi:hypothetical protein